MKPSQEAWLKLTLMAYLGIDTEIFRAFSNDLEEAFCEYIKLKVQEEQHGNQESDTDKTAD